MTDPRRQEAFLDLLQAHKRIALIGGPHTGLEPLAETCTDRPVLHAAHYASAPWSDVPASIIETLELLDSFVLVGCVHAARALRKGLSVDAVTYLDLDHESGRISQDPLAKSVETIFRGWRRLHRTIPVVSPDRLPI